MKRQKMQRSLSHCHLKQYETIKDLELFWFHIRPRY